MAEIITFDTGLKEYEINGAVTVCFNPTDSEFVERMYRAFTDLDAKQDQFREEVDNLKEDPDGMFIYSHKRDEEMRAIVDDLLGEGVSDAIFVDKNGRPFNTYSLANGLPVWMNLMLVIAELVQKAYELEHKASDPRLKKMSGKYKQLTKKYKK